jgi:hypothetical protein
MPVAIVRHALDLLDGKCTRHASRRASPFLFVHLGFSLHPQNKYHIGDIIRSEWRTGNEHTDHHLPRFAADRGSSDFWPGKKAL